MDPLKLIFITFPFLMLNSSSRTELLTGPCTGFIFSGPQTAVHAETSGLTALFPFMSIHPSHFSLDITSSRKSSSTPPYGSCVPLCSLRVLQPLSHHQHCSVSLSSNRLCTSVFRDHFAYGGEQMSKKRAFNERLMANTVKWIWYTSLGGWRKGGSERAVLRAVLHRLSLG